MVPAFLSVPLDDAPDAVAAWIRNFHQSIVRQQAEHHKLAAQAEQNIRLQMLERRLEEVTATLRREREMRTTERERHQQMHETAVNGYKTAAQLGGAQLQTLLQERGAARALVTEHQAENQNLHGALQQARGEIANLQIALDVTRNLPVNPPAVSAPMLQVPASFDQSLMAQHCSVPPPSGPRQPRKKRAQSNVLLQLSALLKAVAEGDDDEEAQEMEIDFPVHRGPHDHDPPPPGGGLGQVARV